MLPTVLRRWSRCYSYFVWLCAFTTGSWCLVLPFSSFSCFSFLFSIVITSLGEMNAGLYVLLFILHALKSVPFLFLLVSIVGYGSWLWHSLDLSINFGSIKTFPDKLSQFFKIVFLISSGQKHVHFIIIFK